MLDVKVRRLSATVMFAALLLELGPGCARIPYVTTMVYEDQRVSVALQREVEGAGYTHPIQLIPQQVEALLRGFSLREEQRLPLRWFAEEAPPKKLFREDELSVLAPQLADALRKVGPEERVYFKLFAPGMNQRYQRDVTGGWVAVRGPLLQLTVDYFHVQQPVSKSDPYDANYPTPWTPEKRYLLYFEPGRFYRMDLHSDRRGVEFREFLKTSASP
ncbi:MAG: hypothetical protein Q8L74_06090 [Nitrospirota bacterium]|nr:hypothetical protein [Nitrospirota bacterium]MDP2383594.1 hypothetical protein [Nitrospirota bacterium]MDP3599261.1 hypothetical protein [Nitrospirota bacterium]